MIRVGVHKALVGGRLWRIAILTAAGAVGTAAQAEAATYYWFDSDAGYSRLGPIVPHRRQKPRHHQAKKIEAPEKETAKPQGPLIIAMATGCCWLPNRRCAGRRREREISSPASRSRSFRPTVNSRQ